MNDTTLILLWVIFIRPSSVSDLNAKLATRVAEGVEGAPALGTKLETSLQGFEFCSQCWENTSKRCSPVLFCTTN